MQSRLISAFDILDVHAHLGYHLDTVSREDFFLVLPRLNGSSCRALARRSAYFANLYSPGNSKTRTINKLEGRFIPKETCF
jgi:hypothetical protein